MKPVIKLGVLYGGLSILASLVLYLVNPNLLFNGTVSLIMTGAFLAILVFAGRYFLRQPDEDLSYGTAVKLLFISILIGSVLNTAYTVSMYGTSEKMKTNFEEYSIRSAEKGIEVTSQMLGLDDAEIADAKAEYREQLESGTGGSPNYPFSPSAIPLTFLLGAFIGLIYALIAGIFVKKKG